MATRFLSLATDLYELTMAAAYFENGMRHDAAFELFVRHPPKHRNFLVAAGLETALEYLETLRFGPDEVGYLKKLPGFGQLSPAFFEYLECFKFTGEAWAMPEGTLAFANEPLLRVTAPIIEAQIVETFLLSVINFQTMIATKAVRVVQAAAGRGVIEFGGRRAHGTEAAMLAARAAYIGGCIGTSNVEAGKVFGLPVYGTIAHSFVMAFEDEIEAFRAYHRVFPDTTVLLLDTYDTVEAAKKAIEFGPSLRGVRLDSGNVGSLSRTVRALLDEAGMQETKILASGDLDEHKIARLIDERAEIDFFGVGTALSTSIDQPALGGIYKLVEESVDGQWRPKIKLSPGKSFFPYRKQVWRRYGPAGFAVGDVLAIHDEDRPTDSESLLIPVMRDGKRLHPAEEMNALQERTRISLQGMPADLFHLSKNVSYSVMPSERLREETDSLWRTCAERGVHANRSETR